MCKKVRDLVYSDNQVGEKAHALGNLHGSFLTILHDWLGMRKLTALFVPNAFVGSGLMTLENRWSKCITLAGNKIDKEEVDLNLK